MFGGKQWERKRRRYESTCLIGLDLIIEYKALLFFAYIFSPMARQTNSIVMPWSLHPYSREDCIMPGSQFVSARAILSVFFIGIYFVKFVWGLLPKEKTSLKGNVCVCVCVCVFERMHMFVGRDSLAQRLAYEMDVPRIESRSGWNFRTRPERPWGPPNLLHNDFQVIPGTKEAVTWPWPSTTIYCRG
jgi:hypothetical protein